VRPVALVVLTLLSVHAPAAAHAQTQLQEGAAALHDAAVLGCADAMTGPLVVRVTTELPDATDPGGLVSALIEPTVTALRADPRFEVVHLASFAPSDESSAAQIAQRLGYANLLDLWLRVQGGSLVVEGSIWSTAEEERLGTLSQRIDIDMALRRFLGFPTIVADDAVRARSTRMPGRGYIALAAADLDGDGRDEIVGIRPGEAHVVRVRGAALERGRLERLGRAGFPEDLPRALIPRRRVLATAVGADERVLLRTSEHAVGVEIRLEGGSPVASVSSGPCETDRFPLVGACAGLVAGRDFFTEALTQSIAPYDGAAGNFYAYSFRQFETRAAETTSFEALVTPAGRLALRVRWHRAPDAEHTAGEIRERSAGAVGYGTALAMADLDFDGAAELLVSHAAPAGGGDQLSLLRALPRGALRVMWRGEPVGGSIWLAASGDVDGDGLPEMLAIEEPAAGRGRAALWIVR